MARARGANALAALAFASTYGAVPASDYRKIAFGSLNLGEEQGLIDSELLGFGREPLEASDDVINNDGDISVPVDARLFGIFLKMLFGAPVTTQGRAASGSITLPGNPAANDTITVGGQVFTFKASPASATDIKIGATLKDSVSNAVWALNASTVAGVIPASYATDLDYAAILITHDTIGTAGNSFTIAASAGTASGATLAGGSTSGPYNHVFSSGQLTLPDAALEIGHPDVPSFHMNYGVMANTLTLALQRSGNLAATIALVAQGEKPLTTSTATGTPEELAIERFSQFAGQIAYAGVPLGEVVSGQLNYTNGLDKAENIRSDGRIDGADAGMIAVTPSFVMRYRDTLIDQIVAAKKPIDISYGWSRSADQRLTFRHPAVRLPKPRRSIPGPQGIQRTYETKGQKDATLGKSLIVTLVNDVATY